MNIFEKAIYDWTAGILKTEYKYDVKNSLELSSLIEYPPSPELGDYALPCFSFSKTLHLSPDVIASELESKLQKHLLNKSPFTNIKARGPYLNFTVSSSSFA